MKKSKFKKLIILAMLGALAGSVSVNAIKDYGEDLSALSPEDEVESRLGYYNFAIESLTADFNYLTADFNYNKNNYNKNNYNKLCYMKKEITSLIKNHEKEIERFEEYPESSQSNLFKNNLDSLKNLKNNLNNLKENIDKEIEIKSHFLFGDAIEEFKKFLDENENQNYDNFDLSFEEFDE